MEGLSRPQSPPRDCLLLTPRAAFSPSSPERRICPTFGEHQEERKAPILADKASKQQGGQRGALWWDTPPGGKGRRAGSGQRALARWAGVAAQKPCLPGTASPCPEKHYPLDRALAFGES